MAKTQTLSGAKRSKLGTRASKQLRADGRIPAMLEVDGDSPHVDLSIELREFLAARRAHAHLFDIEIEGDTESAVVEHIQWDAIRGVMLHVEFRRVKKGVIDTFEVPLVIFGQPKGGVATLLHSEVEIRTLPSLIPDSIEINVSECEEGAVVTAADVKLPEGVEWGTEADTELLVISSAQGEDEDAEEDEDGEVEIIGEKPAEEPDKED